MKIASISETKNNLSAYLDLVRNGETILITDRNKPVARLEPVSNYDDQDDEGRLARLERAGVICRSKRRGVVRSIIDMPPPTPLNGASILRALLEDREEGR